MQIKKHIDGRIPSNHPDVALLAKNCNCENFLRSASGNRDEFSYDGNYFRVTFLRYWSSESITDIEKAFEQTNEQTSEYRFELIDFDNWEMEFDEDRYWDASFTFLAHKK